MCSMTQGADAERRQRSRTPNPSTAVMLNSFQHPSAAASIASDVDGPAGTHGC